MSEGIPQDSRALGTLRAAEGRGVVRMEHRFDCSIKRLWEAITDPKELAQWHAEVAGDLKPGGTFGIVLEAEGWEGTGSVEACEPPAHLVVTTRESDESWRKGQGVAPFDQRLDIRLTRDGRATVLLVEVQGLPLDPLPYYGVGWQLHFERLSAFVAGREFGDAESRWEVLEPLYLELAAALTP